VALLTEIARSEVVAEEDDEASLDQALGPVLMAFGQADALGVMPAAAMHRDPPNF
jgi:hypothetical protein